MVHIKRASQVWLRSYLQQSIAKEAVIVLLVSDILHTIQQLKRALYYYHF